MYILLLLGSILANYIFGLCIDRYSDAQLAKFYLIVAIVFNVALLGIFKYFNFFAENFSALLHLDIKVVTIALPIGISFYTFQILSYIIDVYLEKVAVQKNLAYLALYVSLFPQLIAGPIVRYQTIEEALNFRVHSFDNFAIGVRRFVIGLLKKVVIANPLGLLWELSTNAQDPTVLLYWLGAVGFALQIYFDFSAYSDMGIGLGRMFGFHFLENFNYPYVSKSITEFWQRWHISLGTWFKDYLYIPLGGNKTSKLRWYVNIAIVWIVTGLWHGANWNFVLWGTLFGVILIFEKHYFLKKLNALPASIGHIYTLLIVILSFVLFKGASYSETAHYFKGMFGFIDIPFATFETFYYLGSNKWLLITAIFFSTPAALYLKNRFMLITQKNKSVFEVINTLEPVMIIILLFTVTGFLVDSSFNPFLYFRF